MIWRGKINLKKKTVQKKTITVILQCSTGKIVGLADGPDALKQVRFTFEGGTSSYLET